MSPLPVRRVSTASFLHVYTVLFSAAVFYDCITTFHHEVNLFWRGGRTGATILFLINRYLLVAFYIFSFAIQEANPKVCMS